jgi:hypothetical protein
MNGGNDAHCNTFSTLRCACQGEGHVLSLVEGGVVCIEAVPVPVTPVPIKPVRSRAHVLARTLPRRCVRSPAHAREVRDNAPHAPAERVEEFVRGADMLEGEAAREVGAGGGGEGSRVRWY